MPSEEESVKDKGKDREEKAAHKDKDKSKEKSKHKDRDKGKEKSKSKGKEQGRDASSKGKKRSHGDDADDRKKKKHKKKSKSEDEESSSSSSDSSSDSSSSDSSDSSDSSSDSDDRKKKKSRGKKGKKGKSSKSKKKSKRKSKGKKKGKQKKKDILGKVKSMNDCWGRYGTVNSMDFHAKAPEFYAWLYEIKHIDRMGLGQKEEKTYFLEYAEDFNTGTFPDEKYYDLAKWQMSQHKTKDVFDDPNMRDEDRLLLERQQAKQEQAAAADRMRVQAIKQKLAMAKETNREEYLDAVDRQFASYQKPTFESIAKERAAKKEKAERAYR